MLRALRLLLAALLAVPAPLWAAGNVGVSAPVAGRSVPSANIALPTVPVLPVSLTAAGLGASISVSQTASLGLPQASVGAAKLALPQALPGAKIPAALPTIEQQQPTANPAKTALGRLQTELPFAAPQAGDSEGGKSFADKAFDFKVGAQGGGEGDAVTPEAKGSGGGTGGGGGKGGADDGGGDNYPSRSVRFWGKLFRRTLFRPNVPVEPEIIRAIDTAKKSIHIALYEFKLPGILDALRRARERGVEVHIVIDYSNVFPKMDPNADWRPRRSREIWALLREGFDVKVLRGMSEFGINHNKFAVFDHGEAESMAVFGSFNWTRTAEEDHYENANFSNTERRVDALKQYWDWLNTMAVPEDKARDHQWPSTVPPIPVQIAETINFNGLKLPPVVLSPTSEPGKSIEDRLVQAIDASKTSVEVAAFALRSTTIVEALLRAKKRKLKTVRVIIDKSQHDSPAFGDYTKWLAANGIEVRILAGPDPNADFQLSQKHHHKFMIFDGELVESGSANFTKYGGMANYENSHFLDEKIDVEAYSWIYQRLWKRAEKFDYTGPAPALPTDAELIADALKPVPPHPRPDPHPGPSDPSIQPRIITHNGAKLPTYAFRPDTPIEPIIVAAVESAEKTIRMALYEFKLPNVLDALRRAKERGVKIELVVDRSHVYTTGKDSTNQPRKPSAEIQALIAEGFDVLVLKGEKGGIMHNKFLVVDAGKKGGFVQYGSYNYAKTAEYNHYENIQITDDNFAVADYVAYFNYMRGLAAPVDQDKLDEVLSRGLDAADSEESDPRNSGIDTGLGLLAAEAERAAGDARDSKNPPPPSATGPKINLNGEEFTRRYFSPQGGVLDAWIRAINTAKSTIDIAMFGFYSKELAEAVIARVQKAKDAGETFEVRMALDAGQSTLAKIDGTPVNRWFAERGVNVHMLAGPNEEGDPMYEKQHNKFMLIDGNVLFSGSFNLSPTAENLSFENSNLTDDKNDVAAFVEYFIRMFGRGWPPRTFTAGMPASRNAFE